MPRLTGIEADRLERLSATENGRFEAERPISRARLERARHTMPRGVPSSWMDDLYEHSPVWITHGEGAASGTSTGTSTSTSTSPT